MKFEDFMVGDILSCDMWQEQKKYLVVGVNRVSRALRLQNMGSPTDNPFWWDFYDRYPSINIERDPDFVNKTPIEHKIAHLYKLFEERNKS